MNTSLSTSELRWLRFFLFLAIAVNFSGLFVPLMDPDAGVYAALAKNMLARGNGWELYFQNHDWLDKPHFPFWITAVSFKIFGMHNWSYKLPGILFVLLGAWYTFQFARRFYSQRIAWWSVIILLTAEHIIISNNDVRAEPFLTGLIIAAIYHLVVALKRNWSWHLVIGSLFAAAAVMTKGIFTLIPIGGAIVSELLLKKDWKNLFHWRWLLVVLAITVFITPELYSLWLQFDQHPEKIVFGNTGVSGIRFFLWDSQFGRFFNTGPMKGQGDPFFFIHTLLWAFLPWSLMMYAALINRFRLLFRKSSKEGVEWFTLGGSIFTLLVFSLSKFQLPYYANIIFPLLAIMTAQLISQAVEKNDKAFRIIQYSIIGILIVLGLALGFLYQPDLHPFVLLLFPLAAIVLLVLVPRWAPGNGSLHVFYRTGLAIVTLNCYLHFFFYPDLLQYQSANQAAFFLNKELPEEKTIHTSCYAPVFEYYLHAPNLQVNTEAALHPEKMEAGIWYVSNETYAKIQEQGIRHEVIRAIDEFHVTTLSLEFVNHRTRSQQLKKFYLVRIL